LLLLQSYLLSSMAGVKLTLDLGLFILVGTVEVETEFTEGVCLRNKKSLSGITVSLLVDFPLGFEVIEQLELKSILIFDRLGLSQALVRVLGEEHLQVLLLFDHLFGKEVPESLEVLVCELLVEHLGLPRECGGPSLTLLRRLRLENLPDVSLLGFLVRLVSLRHLASPLLYPLGFELLVAPVSLAVSKQLSTSLQLGRLPRLVGCKQGLEVHARLHEVVHESCRLGPLVSL